MILRPANVIADAILAMAAKDGYLMSNLKLQKLLYYVQAYHLGKLGTPAFNDAVKAWAHGPLVPEVYHRFKRFSWQEITEVPKMPALPERTVKAIQDILRRFGGLSGVELENMTHAEAPWIEARARYAIGAPVSPTISTITMKRLFSGAS